MDHTDLTHFRLRLGQKFFKKFRFFFRKFKTPQFPSGIVWPLDAFSNSRKFYNAQGAYGTSKVAQIMSSIYLNNKCETMENCHVTFNSVHPGVVNTDLYAHARYVTLLFKLFMKSPGKMLPICIKTVILWFIIEVAFSYLSRGPSLYYVSKILEFFWPTHP